MHSIVEQSGGGGIRTLGTEQTVHRFSKPALSTTQAPLRVTSLYDLIVRVQPSLFEKTLKQRD